MSERTWQNVKLEKDGERWKVLARLTDEDDWHEVESILGLEHAERFADQVENDDDIREELIDEAVEAEEGDEAREHDLNEED